MTATLDSIHTIRDEARARYREQVVAGARGKPFGKQTLLDTLSTLGVTLKDYEKAVELLRRRIDAGKALDDAGYHALQARRASKELRSTKAERERVEREYRAKLQTLDARIAKAERDARRFKSEAESAQKVNRDFLLKSSDKALASRARELNAQRSDLLGKLRAPEREQLRTKREYLAQYTEMMKGNAHPKNGDVDQSRKRLAAELAGPRWRQVGDEFDKLQSRLAEIDTELKRVAEKKLDPLSMAFA